MFAPQQEIWDYLRMCARKYGVDKHIRYGCAVQRADWDDGSQALAPRGRAGRRLPGRAVVSASGALHVPSYPDIPGAGPLSAGRPSTPRTGTVPATWRAAGSR